MTQLQMSDNQCNWMLVAGSNTTAMRLFICSGNYNWTSLDVTRSNIDTSNPGITLGINFLQPC